MAFPIAARFAHPDAGWPMDQEHAAEVLTVGTVYTVRDMRVSSSSSSLTLYEVPGQFNTALFEAAVAHPDDEFPATWAGGHALIIESGDEELLSKCQCGELLGTGTPATCLDVFGEAWERHVMSRRAA